MCMYFAWARTVLDVHIMNIGSAAFIFQSPPRIPADGFFFVDCAARFP